MIRLALIFLLIAGSAQAQQLVAIQAGEHEDFSRIVLSIDPDVDWSLEAGNGKAVLTFPQQNLNFVTNQIFDRIPRSRLMEVEPIVSEAGSALQLILACDCTVRSFAFKGAYIVVDIGDGPPLDSIPAPQADTAQASQYWRPGALVLAGGQVDPVALESSTSPQQPAQIFEHAPPLANGPQVADPADTQEFNRIEDAGLDALPLLGPELAEIVLNPLTSEDPAMLLRIEQAQSQLLEQLARAADQGLLEFVPPEAEQPEPEIVRIEPHSPEVVLPALDVELLQQLSARTAYDQNTEGLLTQVVNEFAKPQCIDEADFGMVNWSDGTPFAEQIGVLRVGLIGEFDAPNKASLTALIHLYLRFGFGAEAALLLSEDQWQLENNAILVDFANILDDGLPSPAGPVSKGRGCGGAHEMWYLLNAPTGPEILEADSVIEAFASYPIEIRTLTGPALAAAFTARNQIHHAHIVLEIVRRADGPITPAQRLAEAHILESAGETNAAMAVYREIAVGTGALVPRALVSLARLSLANDGPVPEGLLVDLGAAVHLEKDTALGQELRLWEIRVEAKTAGMVVALSSITHEIERAAIDRAELQNLVAEVLESASPDQAGVLEYVRLVLAYQGLLPDGGSADSARLNSAQNLVGIGLPEPALVILSPAMARNDPELNRVAATAMLLLYRPEEALGLIETDNSAGATQIRLEAELSRINFSAVAEILPVAVQQNLNVVDAALRAGEWQQAQGNDSAEVLAAYQANQSADTGRFQPAEDSDDKAFLTEVIAPDEPNLQQARELLEVNRASRSYLEELLAADLGG